MKHVFPKMALLLLLSTTLLRCSEDEQAPSQENVAVTFSFSAESATNGRIKAETPDVLYLSLTKSTGEPFVTYQKVKILSVGDSYISEPVNLPPGSYRISDFLLADEESDSVLFAVPKKGSPLAKFVNHPLPHAVVVAREKVVNIAMEVIDVSASTPEDFGYVAFQIHPVNPLQLSVFLQTASNTQLVTARAFLLTGDDTTKVYELGARINAIGIPGDPQTTHTLVVVKPGYALYKQELKYSDLTSKSITVFLSPAFTIVANMDPSNSFFGFYAEGSSGTIHVDWGDGTAVESYSLTDPPGYIERTYATGGKFFITITGDLDKITIFKQYYYPVLYVDLYRLTELKDLQISIAPGLKVVDMIKNTRLEKVTLSFLPDLENFIISEQNSIINIRLEKLEQITTPVIDDAINKVYNSATLEGRLTGRFDFYNYEFGTTELTPIGPPSPSTLAKLIELRDNYGWSIQPLP